MNTESFILAKKFVPKDELIKVAKAILRAQNTKEESWDFNSERYKKSNSMVTKEVVDFYDLQEIWIPVIHGWNTFYWNDAQYFAQAVLEKYDK